VALWMLIGSAQAQPAGNSSPPETTTSAPTATSSAPTEPPSASRASSKLEQAKELFFKGNALRKAGDYAGALPNYLRSRKLVPSVANTMNAASCLTQLGRYDEALEFYEEVLAEFRQQVTDEHRKAIARAAEPLRRKVGSIDVSGNVVGTLVIDGRQRGKLPLLTAVRAMPGKHEIIVIKEGYEAFSQTVQVAAGQTTFVKAWLKPLTDSGRLRLVHDGLVGATVYVDGAPVGNLPWEGNLAVGPHLYWVRKANRGSGLRQIVVVEGQTVDGPLKVSLLGPELTVTARPHPAKLWIDGVALGKSSWHGRLPLGQHEIVGRLEGYFDQRRKLSVTPMMSPRIGLELPADENHPRWQTHDPGHFWLAAFAGPAITSSFASGAESSCGELSCSYHGTAIGLMAGLRGGYEFPVGISLELAGGYVGARKQLSRQLPSSFSSNGKTVNITYELTDTLQLAGGFVAVGASYRWPVTKRLELRGRLLAGALFAHWSDRVNGTVSAGTSSQAIGLENENPLTKAYADVFLLPELGLALRFDQFDIGMGLGVGIFFLAGPDYDPDNVVVSPAGCDDHHSESVSCARPYPLQEQAFDPFLLWLPTVSVGYTF